MKIRFIEYNNDIYVVVGITYDTKYFYPECFVSVPINDTRLSIIKAMLSIYTINIPISEAKEITDKNKLLSLMLLYG